MLEPFAEVRYLPGASIKQKDLIDADALLVRTRTRCNAELLSGTAVKFIATATIGYDHIDTAWCESKGIHWTNAPGCNSWSVHQYMASALLLLAQKKNYTLRGKTLGIIGVGHVGSKIATLGEALGMKVLLNDPPRARKEGSAQFTGLDDLLKQSDIVSLHVPLNQVGPDKTWHLADYAFFSALREGAWFVNASRGEVMDTPAVKHAVKTGRIGALVLDVWEHEPDIDRELLSLADIATPHIAGYSVDGKAMGTAMSVQALGTYFNLPVTRWFPADLPAPSLPVLKTEIAEDVQNALATIIAQTYDIFEDDKRMRESPETFEKQRGSYPPRREFTSFKVKAEKTDELSDALKQIGFTIQFDKP
ncbi:MAG: 4-phosphoerythronate dehydrogenase PdxB [Bacteroidales bacterium]